MSLFFNEKNLKDALRNMSEDEREQFVNGFIDILGMPESTKQGNQNLDTAYMNIGMAITLSKVTRLAEQEAVKIQKYLDKFSPNIFLR